VMELLEGESLERRLARLGRLALGEALHIMQQVASSLGAVHQRGIVHRDLKPDNIFLVRDLVAEHGERAKILDFGIAKISGASGMKTETSVVMGTPMFMSPEQCRGAGLVDQRSDVYSLGCVLFMLITGRTPFVAEGTGEIIAMHLREPAPAPSSLVPGVPHGIDALVLRCMEKDPARRFASASDLADALAALLPAAASVSQRMSAAMPLPDPVSVVRIMAPGQQATTLSTYARTAGQGRPVGRPVGKQRAPLMGWLYAGLVAAGLSMGAVVVTTLSEPDAPPPPRVENVTIGASIEDLPPAVKAAGATPTTDPPTAPLPAAAEAPALPPESTSPKIPETAPAVAPAPTTPAPKIASKPAPAMQAKPAKPDLPDLDVIGTKSPPAAAVPAGPSTKDPAVCADQAAKVDAFVARAYAMPAAAAMKTAGALGTSCLDANQRFRLALVAIPIACSLDDRASVTRFFNLAHSESLRTRCKKLLISD
jgi:hypothetical protein